MQNKSTFKLPHWSTIIGLVVLIAMLVGDRIFTIESFSEAPMKIVMDRNIALREVANSDNIIAQLRKGDTLLYFGVYEAGYQRPCGPIVQTQNGERGLLSAIEMGYPLVRTGSKDTTRLTVIKIEKQEKSDTKCTIINGEGKEQSVNLANIRPIMPDSMRNMALRVDGDYYMSRKKFERLYIGSTLEANDCRYRPAIQIDQTKTGWTAYYPQLEVIDDKDGRIHNPIIEYGADSIAVGYIWNEGHAMSNNRWIVRYMPLLKQIVDCDVFAQMISGSIYGNWYNGDREEYGDKVYASLLQVPWYSWLILVAMLVLFVIWAFFMCTLPALILDASLYCRWLYYHLSDKVLALIFSIVTLIAMYIWIALMAVWGIIWPFLPGIFIAGIGGWVYAQRLLETKPHERCLQCRRMEINEFVKREFDREFDRWERESEKVGSSTSHWKTWTRVTEKYSNGSTKTYDKDVKNHKRTETTYADYNVLYHVKVYINFYECQGCHYIEEVEEEVKNELKREFAGQHTTVSYS
ncbi:MAG: hypothetical protein J5761_01980 [Paludibacteraceae bacterium]|nr:hypothetical protein [Paludibacteraceae bacterium]